MITSGTFVSSSRSLATSSISTVTSDTATEMAMIRHGSARAARAAPTRISRTGSLARERSGSSLPRRS